MILGYLVMIHFRKRTPESFGHGQTVVHPSRARGTCRAHDRRGQYRRSAVAGRKLQVAVVENVRAVAMVVDSFHLALFFLDIISLIIPPWSFDDCAVACAVQR